MSILDLSEDSNLNQVNTSQSTIGFDSEFLSEEFRTALNILPHLILINYGDKSYCNLAMQKYFGFNHQNIMCKDLYDFIHPDDLEKIKNILVDEKLQQKNIEHEFRLLNDQGQYQWFLVHAENHLTHPFLKKHQENLTLGQQAKEWIVTCTNIHERVIRLNKTTELLQINSKMLDMTDDRIQMITSTGHVSHINKSGRLALFGNENVIDFGMEWLDLLSPEHRKQGSRALKEALEGKKSRFSGKSISTQGDLYWENVLTPVLNQTGEITSIVCSSRDITEQKHIEEQLRQSSNYDELTGLMNRRAFKSTLLKAIAKANRNQTSIGMMFIDLDYFKNINDTLGHSAGDHLLRVLAKRIKKFANSNTHIARLGGDEFGIIITNMTDHSELYDTIQNVLKLNDVPVSYAGKFINGGMSIGCAVYPKDASDVLGLMKCADTALNDLKDRGRGGYRMYDGKMLELAVAKSLQIETARRIIRENRIEPFYQPKVRLDNRSIIGFEALLRWRDNEQMINYPSTVAEAFNDYELATKFSEMMHEKVFTHIANWLKVGINVVPISINASPIEFMRDNYAEILIRRLNSYNIPYRLIEIEITEHFLSERGSEFVIRALRQLKDLGLRISLDDFGTGHSSMTHLRDYPVDCLKIDYAFVSRMNEEKSICSIVEGIAKLGPIMSLDVIAEGIETVQQLISLQKVGCKYGQGFLFSRAIPAKEAEIMLCASFV